jgi:hypothetical protein
VAAAFNRCQQKLSVATISISPTPWRSLVGSMKHDPRSKAELAFNPTFTVSCFRTGAWSDNPTFLAGRERIYEGLRNAGLPEE